MCAVQRNGASGYSTPSSGDGLEARQNGHVTGREFNGKMAALHINADIAEEDEAPDSFCCPITHVSGHPYICVMELQNMSSAFCTC